MNCACCWPQLPPPASLNGVASGVKNTPVRFAPLPPVMTKDDRCAFDAVAGMSVQYASPANGPSTGALHVGGLPENATDPVPPYTKTWLKLTAPVPLVENCVLLSPRKYTIAACLLDVLMHGRDGDKVGGRHDRPIVVLGLLLLGVASVGSVLMFRVPPFETVTLSSNTTLPPRKVTETPPFTTKPLLPRVHFT